MSHRAAIDLARREGRAGAERLSDDVLFADGFDPTGTYIDDCLDAWEAGRRERQLDAGDLEAVREEMLQMPESI